MLHGFYIFILIFILTFHLILILNSFFLHSILLILHNMLTSLPTVIIILWILLLLTLTLNSFLISPPLLSLLLIIFLFSQLLPLFHLPLLLSLPIHSAASDLLI